MDAVKNATPIAIKAVEIVAGDIGAALETDASLRGRAATAVHHMELELERMKAAARLCRFERTSAACTFNSEPAPGEPKSM